MQKILSPTYTFRPLSGMAMAETIEAGRIETEKRLEK